MKTLPPPATTLSLLAAILMHPRPIYIPRCARTSDHFVVDLISFVKMLLVLGVRNPHSTVVMFGAFVSRIKCKSMIISLFLTWYCFCIHLYVTICMKLDTSMHIGLHLVFFRKIGVTEWYQSCVNCRT
jgi:hypothetical protein